jgi:hypothetical protein
MIPTLYAHTHASRRVRQGGFSGEQLEDVFNAIIAGSLGQEYLEKAGVL